MKRLLFIILLAFSGLVIFAQNPTKYVHLLPAYPPAIGETQYGNYVYTNSGLYMHDIILDSLPHYEIEHIPDQTVRFLEDGIGFYVKADSLHSNQVVYNYTVDVPPIGPFEFNANTGRFKFYPDAGDYMPITVTFTATSGGNSLSQVVEFTIMPEVLPEESVIQSLGTMPSAQEYTIITETHWDTTLNNLERTVYSYSISGKEIVFDNNVQNKVYGLSGQENLYELNIFAERLYIRSALAFPHTNVNIYARELIFEDNGSEIASINTTPSAIGTETNVTSMNGENAGNITLHVNKLTANYAKRFILNGAKGQNANLNGIPGNGGNGGVLSAPINIDGYGDFARGSAGVQFDTLIPPSVIGAGQAGVNGHFERITDRYSWVHPYYIAAVIRHLNDAYLNDYFSFSKSTANDYYNLINEFEASDEWEDLDGALKMELQDQTFELQSLLYRLNDGLDYFGNPTGWTPMLSFEVYFNIFDDEIDRSMPTLYLNYWLQNVEQSLANKVEAARVAAEQTEDDIEAEQDRIDVLTEDIPRLEGRIEVLKGQIEETTTRFEQLKAQLMAKAKHNVKKKNRLNKAFGIATGVLNCIPVYGQIASAALTIGGSYFGLVDTYGYGSALSSTYQSFLDVGYSSELTKLKQAIDSTGMGNQIQQNYSKYQKNVTSLISSINTLQKAFSESSAPNDQVKAEYTKLCSQSVEFKKLEAELTSLKQSCVEIKAVCDQTMYDIFTLTSEVSNDMVTLDALRGDVFQGNSKRDLQAMQCVEKMRQRAMNRLIKYHYYMRKAYEYRMLSPYQGDFSLETMYDRIETLLSQAFDSSSSEMTVEAHNTICSLFREEVSGIVEDVIEELTHNAHENTASITIALPHEVLDKINANEEYTLNMFDLGLFSPDEENIRIVDFNVQYIEAHTEGNTGMTTYMDINLVHSGMSNFRKDGEVYWFNHISKSNENPHPNAWRIRYNPTTQETTIVGPSFATESLLYTVLNMSGNATVNNVMLFSRPAAWSDIYVSKKVQTSGNADVVIDSLVLSLQYDFTDRTSNVRYIDIATSDGLLPYITCSEADLNGRSNGKGTFHRSYATGNGTVTFTAEEAYGNYHFVNWSDRVGTVITESAELTVSKMTDQFYRANYELWIPVIDVADTIYVGNEGGEYMVQIRNVGLGDIEMDWYVSDSLSTWVHIDGIAEGIDDGYFTFAYEPFSSQGSRIDSLEILAPEIEGMSKTIYIVQYDHLLNEVINAYASPANGGTVSGGGTYTIGSICTLTATPHQGYEFVNWTENGEEVSSDATYSFEVTGSRTLVANFEVIPTHWSPVSLGTSGSMVLIGKIQINGIDQTSDQLELGVFCGNECRGTSIAHLFEYVQPSYYMVDPMVYGDAGDVYTFKLFDHSIGQELILTPPESITFIESGYGTVFEPYILNFISAVNHTQALSSGWNWWSTYIEMDGVDGLDMLKNSLGDTCIRIQSRNQYLDNYTTFWYGSLTAITNEQSYRIRTNAECEATLVGFSAIPENHPITINNGWNWVGFPCSFNVSVSTAFNGFSPEVNDQMKGRHQYAVYLGNNFWYGTLNTLESGQGYMYMSNSGEAKTLTYQTGRNENLVDNITTKNNYFVPSYENYADNLTFTAVIELDGLEVRSEDYELAAFVGDECRGSVELMYVAPIDRYVAFLLVYGDAEEDMRFVLTNGMETVLSEDMVRFTADATIGTLTNPAILHFGTLGMDDQQQEFVNVYPNPSNDIFNVEGNGIRKVEVIDALGQTILSEEVRGNHVQINLDGKARGIYLLRVITSKGINTTQIIKE